MPRPGLLLALALVSFLFPAALFPDESLLLMDPPYTDSNRDGYWRRATGADSQIVVSKGCIVSEWYSERYRLPVYAMSSTKAKPGSRYSSSNEAVQLLDPIIEAASGYLNTDISVLPSKELVIVRTQAPRSGFRGEDESRGYSERARIIFAELLREKQDAVGVRESLVKME